jgi:hypothetical protein
MDVPPSGSRIAAHGPRSPTSGWPYGFEQQGPMYGQKKRSTAQWELPPNTF